MLSKCSSIWANSQYLAVVKDGVEPTFSIPITDCTHYQCAWILDQSWIFLWALLVRPILWKILKQSHNWEQETEFESAASSLARKRSTSWAILAYFGWSQTGSNRPHADCKSTSPRPWNMWPQIKISMIRSTRLWNFNSLRAILDRIELHLTVDYGRADIFKGLTITLQVCYLIFPVR